MTTLALLASGFLAGILFVVLCAIIGLCRSGDPLNDLGNECADEHADHLWLGGRK